MKKVFILLSILAIASVMAVGCGSSKSTQPLAKFEPEVINNDDSFEFQATGLANVSTTVSYDWVNSGSHSTVDHASALTGGTATVTINDNNGNLVYTSGLVASLNEQSSSGIVGIWKVTVELVNVSGAVSFSADKLTISKPDVNNPVIVDTQN